MTLDQIEGGFAVISSRLTLKAKTPGIDQARFEELKAKAKAGCPISKPLNAEVTLLS